jgi:hypothetical protein
MYKLYHMDKAHFFSGRSFGRNKQAVSPVHWIIWLAVAVVFATLFASCSKNPVVEVPLTEKQLLVGFNAATIPVNLVDSAMVIFKKKGSTTQYLKRFDKGPASMQVAIDDLPNGEWTAEMYIDGRSGNDTSRRQYRQEKSFTKDLRPGNVILNAPAGTIADAWKPSVILTDGAREVQVIVPLDNTDPGFEIRMKDKSWSQFFIERLANHRTQAGNETMASARWECSGNCHTHDNWIFNTTAFRDFSEKVKTKTWNNGEISVEIKGNAPGKALSFFYIYKL